MWCLKASDVSDGDFLVGIIAERDGGARGGGRADGGPTAASNTEHARCIYTAAAEKHVGVK